MYYSVLYNFLQKGIQTIKIYAERTDGGYALPHAQIMDILDDIDAIWLTNPIYNTGIYYLKEDIEFLKSKIPSRILILCDDCFSANGHELIKNFGGHSNFISIHDPLKQIMVNGLKFSCILYPVKYERLFEQWSDIICGSLSYSTVQSIDFFNSSDFNRIQFQLHQHFQDMNGKLQKLLEQFRSFNG